MDYQVAFAEKSNLNKPKGWIGLGLSHDRYLLSLDPAKKKLVEAYRKQMAVLCGRRGAMTVESLLGFSPIDWTSIMDLLGIDHQMGRQQIIRSIQRWRPTFDNAWTESFMKTLKQDEVYLANYETYLDAIENLPRFIGEVYNEKRVYSGIGYLTPNELEERVQKIPQPQITAGLISCFDRLFLSSLPPALHTSFFHITVFQSAVNRKKSMH